MRSGHFNFIPETDHVDGAKKKRFNSIFVLKFVEDFAKKQSKSRSTSENGAKPPRIAPPWNVVYISILDPPF